MRRVFIFILLLFPVLFILGQSSGKDHSITIKEQANIMAKYLIEKDLSSFLRYTHPKLIAMAGGKEKMIATLEKGFKEMQEEGTGFQKFTVGEPSKVIETNKELQATVPQTIEMKVPNGRLVAVSTLIAISLDNGKNWYFLDTSRRDIEAMQKLFPNLSSELMIPAQSKPTFYKN